MLKFFIKLFKICPRCNSWFSMEHSGFWIGGYNELCNQATSRSGSRCYECGFIEWDQSCEEYKKSLPHWCKSNCHD